MKGTVRTFGMTLSYYLSPVCVISQESGCCRLCTTRCNAKKASSYLVSSIGDFTRYTFCPFSCSCIYIGFLETGFIIWCFVLQTGFLLTISLFFSFTGLSSYNWRLNPLPTRRICEFHEIASLVIWLYLLSRQNINSNVWKIIDKNLSKTFRQHFRKYLNICHR